MATATETVMAMVVSLFVTMLATTAAGASGVSYTNGHCVDIDGRFGLNAGVLGDCADLGYRAGTHQVRVAFPRDLAGRALRGAKLTHARLGRADLRFASLDDADLTEAVFRDAHLGRVRAPRARMVGADLRASNLADADLRGADLSAARARGATFAGANLAFANLVAADLTLADVRGCVLAGADLSHAITFGTRFEGAIFDRTTRLPFDAARARALGLIFKEVL